MIGPETGHKETYKYVRKIGEGVFGVISIVRRQSDGQVLCRKRSDWKDFKLLEAEYRAMQSLRHPNIVQVYCCKQEGTYLDMYMEYCSGGDLFGFIKRMKEERKFASEEFVWRVLSQLLSALYCCHYRTHPPEFGANIFGPSDQPTTSKAYEVPILHRDIKPENIFLDKANNIKLGDFGLCIRMPLNCLTRKKAGSPLYMSPEMLQATLHPNSKGYTFPADIWAVGCTIYELCQGEPPFSGKNMHELFDRVRYGAFKPLPDFYSPGLKFVISSCLRVEPGHRPSTAALISLIGIRNHVKMIYGQDEKLEMEARLRQEMEAQLRQEMEAYLRQEMEAQLRQEMEAYLRQEMEARLRQELEDRLAVEIDLQKKNDQTTAPSWRDIQSQNVTELDNGSAQRLSRAHMVPVRTYRSSGTPSESEDLPVSEDKPVKPTMIPKPRPLLIPKHRLRHRIET